MHFWGCGKLLRFDIMLFPNLDFGVRVLFFAFSKIRLHLSIAFESKLSSFCIRFAQTLLREVRLHLSIAFESLLSSLCIRFAQTLKKKRMKNRLPWLLLHRSLTFCPKSKHKRQKQGREGKIDNKSTENGNNNHFCGIEAKHNPYENLNFAPWQVAHAYFAETTVLKASVSTKNGVFTP